MVGAIFFVSFRYLQHLFQKSEVNETRVEGHAARTGVDATFHIKVEGTLAGTFQKGLQLT
jgi:hypothetical protein